MFRCWRPCSTPTGSSTAARPIRRRRRSFLRDRFAHGESILFLAFADDEPAGFTQLYPSFSSVSLARIYILNDLYVVPGRRRTGVGSALLDAAVDYARTLGAVRVSLNTDVRNTTAQATYEARGWKRDREYYAYHFLVRRRSPDRGSASPCGSA